MTSPASTTLTTTTTTDDSGQELPATFGVIPWGDPRAAIGAVSGGSETHDPRSAYVETFWLPIVGPSTTLLLRRLADEFDAQPDGFEIDAAALSREIGLGPRVDQRSSFRRTLERCEKFRLVHIDGPLLHVRRRVPTLGKRLVAKLNPRLRALHGSWIVESADDGSRRRTELVRAAHLARALLALGEAEHDAERQLHRWQFHPSIAWHAVQWALSESEPLP